MGGRAVFVADEIAERPVHAHTLSGAARTMRRRVTKRGACGRMTGSTMASHRGIRRPEKTNRAADTSTNRVIRAVPTACNSAAAIVSVGTRLPVIESSPCAGGVNQTRAQCVADDRSWATTPRQEARLVSDFDTNGSGGPTRMLAQAGGSLAGKLSAEDSSTSADERSSVRAPVASSRRPCTEPRLFTTIALALHDAPRCGYHPRISYAGMRKHAQRHCPPGTIGLGTCTPASGLRRQSAKLTRP